MENIKLDMENLSNEEREQLIALIEKANKPKSKVWKPEIGEHYYIVCSDGTITITPYTDSSYQKDVYNFGNMFPSLEEAKEESECRKILTKWKRLSIESGENENEWNGVNTHWFCYYHYSNGKIYTDAYTTCKYASTYFSTEKSLLDAIAEIGEDNVKKYILDIKE